MKCGDHVETQPCALGGAKKDNDKTKSLVGHAVNGDICSFCCRDDDVASADTIKGRFNMGDKAPLPLYASCLDLNVEPPSTRVATNFGEKASQSKVSKKKLRTGQLQK